MTFTISRVRLKYNKLKIVLELNINTNHGIELILKNFIAIDGEIKYHYTRLKTLFLLQSLTMQLLLLLMKKFTYSVTKK